MKADCCKMKILKIVKEYWTVTYKKSYNWVIIKEQEFLTSMIKRAGVHAKMKLSNEDWTVELDKRLMRKDTLKVSSSTKTEENKKTNNDVQSGSSKYISWSKFIDDIILTLPGKSNELKVPEWKIRRPAHLRANIKLKTLSMLLGIVTCGSSSSRVTRLEEFLTYLYKYPEAVIFATQGNVVPILLLTRRRCVSDKHSYELIRELLCVFGYVDPPSSRGLRILSIDGGGMRGIAVIKMLEEIETLCGKQIHELFDFVCGVSTGALITCCLIPPHRMKMDEIYKLYRSMSLKVFKQNTFWGTSQLLWSHGYYDTNLWESLLKDYLGEMPFIETSRFADCPKVAIISTIVNHSKVAPYVFRNYGNSYKCCSEYHGGFHHTIFEAVRASAAAPTIFEEFKTGNILHQDGGIIFNNPTAVALHEARILWPNERISCIVSCGTGRYEPLPLADQLRNLKAGSTSWKGTFDKILESATDTENVHTLISETLSENIYFRLNPHLSGVVSMDDINDKRISILEQDTKMYYRRNKQKFAEIADLLTAKRSFPQNTLDFIKLQSKTISEYIRILKTKNK